MNNKDRDKFLTEIMGECWHEFDVNPQERHENWDGFATRPSGHWNVCTKCGDDCIEEVANHTGFSTWPGFGKLWEFSQRQKWWNEFLVDWAAPNCEIASSEEGPFYRCISGELVHPDRFANALYEFLKNKAEPAEGRGK